MTKKELSAAVGNISARHIQEAALYFEQVDRPAERNTESVVFRRALLIAAVIICFAAFSAFAISIFSGLDGDALTLDGVYEGNGIVSIQVENRSNKTLEFQPRVKLIRWVTSEEVTPLDGAVIFQGATIAPHSVSTMILDLSAAYDIPMLEQSKAWEWYYLVLTNQNFAYGQEWKCSVNFGSPENNAADHSEPRYSLDPAILSQIEEELRFYFEDDYIGIFAANPMNYEYLQKAQELLVRSGKKIVPLVNPGLISEPIPDGVIVDETAAPEKQYTLTGNTSSVHDAFGKLVGSTETEYVKIIDIFLPAYEGSEDQAWTIPLLYFASFEASAVEDADDCAFIHGRIVSFRELEPYKVYEDGYFLCYDVTHLFYTDLRDYVDNIVAMEKAGGNTNCYFDEQVYRRIENIHHYYRENLSIISWEEYANNIRPRCEISDCPDHRDLVEKGLSGVIDSNRDIERIVFTICTIDGEEVLVKEYTSPDPNRYMLKDAVEVSGFIRNLSEGVYTLDVSVWLDSDVMSYSSLWTQVFVTGNASWPGLE